MGVFLLASNKIATMGNIGTEKTASTFIKTVSKFSSVD